MTTDNLTLPVESTERGIHFAAGGTLYQLHPDATPIDVQDQLHARLAQLHAMLTMTHGAGFDTFNNWSDSIKENYLWGCAMLAKECEELARHV